MPDSSNQNAPNPRTNTESIIQRILPLSLLVVLILLSYKVVAFFISPVIWAAIFAYVTWPMYVWLDKKIPKRPNTNAFLMTTVLSLLIGVPFIIGIFIVQDEVISVSKSIFTRIENGYFYLPKVITDIPTLGPFLHDIATDINSDPDKTLKNIRTWIQSHLSYGRQIVDVLFTNAARAGIATMMLFFFYRDGKEILKQIKRASHLILGDRVNGYFTAMGNTTQAVVYGIGLTAVAQAILAGIGYYFANAPSPVLLTLGTAIVAMIPFGTPVAWGAVVLYLFSQGQTTEAIGLAVWCMLVVSWVDNIIRPIVISGATKIPFMIILIGVLGGLTAFGFIGLFIGPVVLAVALAVWREWIIQHQDSTIQMQAITEKDISELDN